VPKVFEASVVGFTMAGETVLVLSGMHQEDEVLWLVIVFIEEYVVKVSVSVEL
jgi:hypothetical protein